ncbi:MAG: potassium channel family protein [Halothiobacillaceae bacterium]
MRERRRHRYYAFGQALGFAGVPRWENARARMAASLFEIPIMMLVFWLPVQWYLEGHDLIDAGLATHIDQGIWALFLLEQVVLLALVERKRDYLRANWLNVLIVTVGLPLILLGQGAFVLALRLLRVLIIIGMMVRVGRRYFLELSRHSLVAVFFLTLLVVMITGALMPHIEPETFDDFWAAAWWALVTMATVGYGDLVPVTENDRAFAVGLILFGVTLMAMMSAAIAAFLVGLRVDRITEVDMAADSRMEKSLNRLHERLDEIEKRLERIEKGRRGRYHY